MYELGLFLLVPLWQEEPGGKDALAACAAHRHLTGGVGRHQFTLLKAI